MLLKMALKCLKLSNVFPPHKNPPPPIKKISKKREIYIYYLYTVINFEIQGEHNVWP